MDIPIQEQVTLDTVQLQRWVAGLKLGEAGAADALIRHVCGRLERLTRKMLGADPRVHRWEETGDVLQGAFVRLLRALQDVVPQSRKAFFALASLQIRREIIDLARHYYGPLGAGANHASTSNVAAGVTIDAPRDSSSDALRLADWTEFHEAIARLAEHEREVFELHYYQGLKHREVAALLEVDVSTVERRWHAALVAVSKSVRGSTAETQ